MSLSFRIECKILHCNFGKQQGRHYDTDWYLIFLNMNMNMNMNVSNILEAVSDGGMRTSTAAAVGGGVAGGFILLLSLLALCCCLSRDSSRPKHPPVYFHDVSPVSNSNHGDSFPNAKTGTI